MGNFVNVVRLDYNVTTHAFDLHSLNDLKFIYILSIHLSKFITEEWNLEHRLKIIVLFSLFILGENKIESYFQKNLLHLALNVCMAVFPHTPKDTTLATIRKTTTATTTKQYVDNQDIDNHNKGNHSKNKI